MSVLQHDKLSESKIIEQMLEDFQENKIENYDQALNKINKCIEVKEESEAFRVRGMIYSKLKEKDKEFENYNIAIQIDPMNAKAYNSRGCWYMDQKLYGEAIKDFGIAIGLDPLFWKPCFNRGITYKSMKQYEKAIIDYNNVIELNPKQANAFNNRGCTYMDMKQYEKAIMDFNKAIELNPEYANAFNNRGITYKITKQYEKAIMDYNKAIELNSEYADAFNNRGITYKNMKQYEKAIMDYNKAIELNPEYADAFNNRGCTYIDMKQYQKAKEDFQNALLINQNHPLYNTNIGVLYSILNDNQNCQKHLKLTQSILNTQNEMTLTIVYLISDNHIAYIKEQIKLLLQVDLLTSQIKQQIFKLERGNTLNEQDKEEFQNIEKCKVEVLQQQISTQNQNERPQDDELKQLVQQLLIANQKLQERVQNLEQNPIFILQQRIQNIQNNKNYNAYYQSFGSRIINYFDSCCMLQSNLLTQNNEAAIETKNEDLVNKINNAAQTISPFVGVIPFIGDTLDFIFTVIDKGVQNYQSNKLENALINIQSVLMATTISAEDRAIEVKSGIINLTEKQGIFDKMEQELKDSKFSFAVDKIVENEKSRFPEAENLYWQIGIQHSLIVLKYIDQFSSQLIQDKTIIREIILIAIDKRYQVCQINKKVQESYCCQIQ